MADRKGEKKEINETVKIAIWREVLKKEFQTTRTTSDYVVDASRLSLIPENPTKSTLVLTARDPELRSRDFDGVAEKIREDLMRTSSIPSDRFSAPMTASQEYGFYASLQQRSRDVQTGSRFAYPRSNTEITKYAEEVVKSGGVRSTGASAAKTTKA